MKNLFKILLIIAGINFGITFNISRFKHPNFTETELLLHIPKSFIWKFNI